MSRRAVLEFVKEASKNKDLRKEIQNKVNDIVSLGKAYGHKFSRKEFADVLRDRWSGSGAAPHFCGCYVCYDEQIKAPTPSKPSKPSKKPTKPAKKPTTPAKKK